MLFSLYPTDPLEVRAAVLDAATTAAEPLVFTSLHIPESTGMRDFGAQLGELHRSHGLRFCADVSPGTLGLLGIDLDDVGRLRDWGVTMVRIDYGFTPAETARIARAGGFRVA